MKFLEHLEAICIDLGLILEIGRHDFQNLFNNDNNGQAVMFIDYPSEAPKFNKSGGVDSIEISGTLQIGKRSELNELYEVKRQRIASIESEYIGQLLSALKCRGYEVTEWRKTAIINVLDYNMDGVFITFKVTD